MKYGSLFSGIGGELGLCRAGMECVWQVESDPYRREVLERHWPGVERYDDVRAVSGRRPESRRSGRAVSHTWSGTEGRLRNVDLICGGPPCQDLSVAGLRAGLSGSRSGLFWEFARIVGEVLPRWFLMEQVPGLLSADNGRAFAQVVGAFSDLGYGVAWRILDSQFFGVPQRRRRLYFVGHLGGRCDYPAAVLFEPASGGGDSAASGETGEGVAYALSASVRGTGDGHGNAWNSNYVANTLQSSQSSRNGWRGNADETYVPEVVAVRTAQTSANGHGVSEGVAHTLDGANAQAIAAQSAVAGHYIGETQQSVRRLTTVECERLQGFPDGWTDLGNTKDGPRYAALGDAWTVPVIQWIGERIMRVEAAPCAR